MNPVKKLIIFLMLCTSTSVFGQLKGLENILLGGDNFAEYVLANYTKPMDEGLLYGLTGGWFNSAETLDTWKFELSFISNGTYVPSDKRFYNLDISNYENIRLQSGASQIRIPSILGPTKGSEMLFIDFLNYTQEIELPTGIGLADVNLLPSVFLQASIGMPDNMEFKIRYFPKFKVDETKLGIFGVGLQHQFSNWFKNGEDWKIASSFFIGYSNLNGDIDFQANDIIVGTDEHLEFNLDSWTVELITSTKFEIYNAIIGIGYVTGNSRTHLKGSYKLASLENTLLDFLAVTNPLTIRNKLEGPRISMGGKVRLGSKASLNLDYTIQGYNNVTLALNFNLN